MAPNKIFLRIIVLLFSLIVISCKNYTPEEKEYIAEIEKVRSEKNDFMKNSSDSPFNYKGKIHFEPLKYYKIDPGFVFKSKLFEYDSKDTVLIYGTKGEERKAVRYGFIKFNFKGNEFKENVYEGISKAGENYFSIWFTDKTSGKETYGVGRYIDFELNADKNFVYTIDFNLAYNPYCAYSPDYSCAIPTKDDYLNLAVEAGEKKFH